MDDEGKIIDDKQRRKEVLQLLLDPLLWLFFASLALAMYVSPGFLGAFFLYALARHCILTKNWLGLLFVFLIPLGIIMYTITLEAL